MPRHFATFSVSLPRPMASEVDRACKDEHRTRSEFVRQALRHYMRRSADVRRLKERIAELPEEEPTAEEIDVMDEARRAFREGRFIMLDRLPRGMDHRPQRPRRKKSQASSGR
jgi:Arc/MetJ-type ribon-helix-helix transcriptional regulator